jgi:hypothetical protein
LKSSAEEISDYHLANLNRKPKMSTQGQRTSSPKLNIQSLLNFSRWWEALVAQQSNPPDKDKAENKAG